jgi:hypothetical protein
MKVAGSWKWLFLGYVASIQDYRLANQSGSIDNSAKQEKVGMSGRGSS